MNFKVIGLDLDGTLYPITKEDRDKNRMQIYQDISSWLKIPLNLSEKLFEDYYAKNGSGSKTIELIAQDFSKEIDGKDFINESLSKADILPLLHKDEKVVELINYLSKRIKFLDLISAREKNYALRILDKLGINYNIFNTLIFQENKLRKQDGSIYKEWLNLRKIDASSHLYVGDNEKADIDVPNSLGIKTCIIGNYEKADYRINNLLELYNLIT